MVLSVWPFVSLKIYFSLTGQTNHQLLLKMWFHVLIKKRHCRAMLSCPVTLLRNNPRMQASLFALYLAYSVCTTSVNEWTSISTAPPGWCTRHYTVFYKCCLGALTCSCSHCTRHRRGISLQSRINRPSGRNPPGICHCPVRNEVVILSGCICTSRVWGLARCWGGLLS